MHYTTSQPRQMKPAKNFFFFVSPPTSTPFPPPAPHRISTFFAVCCKRTRTHSHTPVEKLSRHFGEPGGFKLSCKKAQMLLHLLIYAGRGQLLNNKTWLQDAAAILLPVLRSVLWRVGASQKPQRAPQKPDVAEELCFSPDLSISKWSAS